jgi:hypothetical protein
MFDDTQQGRRGNAVLHGQALGLELVVDKRIKIA